MVGITCARVGAFQYFAGRGELGGQRRDAWGCRGSLETQKGAFKVEGGWGHHNHTHTNTHTWSVFKLVSTEGNWGDGEGMHGGVEGA